MLDFEWRGFELHPEIPKGGLDVGRMFDAGTVASMRARLQAVADELGVPIGTQDHAPNTQAALALSDLARRHGVLDAWRSLAMDAYWADGRDLEDRGVLAELAGEAGLDPERALAFLDEDGVDAIIAAQREDAWRWGVTGIPTWFLLPDGWAPGDGVPAQGPRPLRVVGCQPMAVVERAAVLAGATPR